MDGEFKDLRFELLKKPDNHGRTALHSAVTMNWPYVVKALLTGVSKIKVGDSNLKDKRFELLKIQDDHKNTALHSAVEM